MNPRIIELIIEDGDNEAGLDGIALVEMPAHEASFEYFSNDEKPTHYVLSDDFRKKSELTSLKNYGYRHPMMNINQVINMMKN